MKQEIPGIAEFFDNLNSIDDLLKGREQKPIARKESQECDTFPDAQNTKAIQPLVDVSDYLSQKGVSETKDFDSSVSGSGMK